MPLLLTDLTRLACAREWRWDFLNELAASANVSEACKAAHVSRFKAYYHRKRFPIFRRKWDEAIDIGVDALAHEVRRRAFDRSDPRSHLFLMFLLKAHKPRMYRDNGHLMPPEEPEPEDNGFTAEMVARLSDEELATLSALTDKMLGKSEPDTPVS